MLPFGVNMATFNASSMQPTASGNHQCPVCTKTFKRRGHLQRHMGSHTETRPYCCGICDRAFQRSDVLRRHVKSCGGTRSHPPHTAKKRRRFSRHKIDDGHSLYQNCYTENRDEYQTSNPRNPNQRPYNDSETLAGSNDSVSPRCDSGSVTATQTPAIQCEQLEELLLHAIGTFSHTDLSQPSNNYTSEDFTSLISNSFLQDAPSPDIKSVRFDFLERYTKGVGFSVILDCGTLEQREQVVSKVECEAPEIESLQTTLSANRPLPDWQQLATLISSPSSTAFTSGNWLSQRHHLDNGLYLKALEIYHLAKEVVLAKSRNSVVTFDWSPTIERMCLQFFAPRNLQKFLGLYWAVWYPNVNFVHRPTFELRSAKPTLLAVMAVIGACVSPDLVDNENARMWFNCVEEMVFLDEDINNEMPSTEVFPLKRTIQALQAAFMVCVYQHFEGTDTSKSRARRYRFAALISAAREIGINTARHPNYNQQAMYEFDWDKFGAREELIRLFLGIFLLDTTFVIFNNLPPRMVTKELTMHMAMPDACFQATTADQCYQQIQLWVGCGYSYTPVSFRSAFEKLCKDQIGANLRLALSALGPLNLFAMASGIHVLLFQAQNSICASTLLDTIRTALRNWGDIWQLFSYSTGLLPHFTVDSNISDLHLEMMWKRLGFVRHCPEFWLLANLMTDSLIGTSQLEAETETEEAFRDDSIGFDHPILSKYDHVNLRSIGDLILSCQRRPF